MFWAKEEDDNSLIQLLKSSNFTLVNVLENEYVVQESRYGKAELVNYITKRENMIELLNMSLNPTVDESLPLKQQYRLSFIASEILTIRGTDVYQQAIVTDEETRRVLKDFINDKKPINHLVAGFFAKIMECLLSKQFDLTFAIICETAFFEKCLQNISIGAIACLLENLSRIPMTAEATNILKQYMIDDGFFEKLIDRIGDHSTDDDNECLSEVYCEVIRELRDKLFIFQNKEDSLHDKIMETSIISRIADKLIVDYTPAEPKQNASVLNAAAKILEILIRSNIVLNCPSYQLDIEEQQDLERSHRMYGSMRAAENRECELEQTWQPDAERVVEGIVVNRLPNVLETVVRDIEKKGSVWLPLLRLICEICNTNHFPTHQKILAAFQQVPLIRLIEAAKNLPRASVLHSLIIKLLSFILYTRFPNNRDQLSPVAEYMLKDSGLIESLHKTAFSFHNSTDLISVSGLRTFNMNIANVILKAKTVTCHAKQLTALLAENAVWQELEEATKDYNGQHRPLLFVDSDDSHLSNHMDNSNRDFNDSEEWADAASKLDDFERSSGINNTGTSSSNQDMVDDQFSFNLHKFLDLDGGAQFDDTPDEDEFKKLCSQRANSSSCSFNDILQPASSDAAAKTDTSGWPGTTANTKSNTSGIADVEDGEWVWPSKPPLGESEVVTKTGPRPEDVWFGEDVKESKIVQDTHNSKDDKSADMWADFSSFGGNKSASSTAASSSSSTKKDGWPGAEKTEEGESSDWPLSNAHDSKATDPVTVGFATGISNHLDTNSSEA